MIKEGGRTFARTTVAVVVAAGVMGLPAGIRGQQTNAPLTRAEAIQLIVNEVIRPKTLDHHLIAWMGHAPLDAGDTVSVFMDFGSTYGIPGPMWFAWLDDEPQAEFAHDTRYVFVDAQTGAIGVHLETWWPELNGQSLWVSQAAVEQATEVFFSTMHVSQ